METKEFLIKTLDVIFNEMRKENCGFEFSEATKAELETLLYKIHDLVFSAKQAIKVIELFEK